jgi:hypothetical protein
MGKWNTAARNTQDDEILRAFGPLKNFMGHTPNDAADISGIEHTRSRRHMSISFPASLDGSLKDVFLDLIGR